MDTPVSTLLPSLVHDEARRLRRDTLALELEQDAPAHLPHRLTVPRVLPVADRARRDAVFADDDDVHPTVGTTIRGEITLVAPTDPDRTLRAAEVAGHRRIADQAFKQ